MEIIKRKWFIMSRIVLRKLSVNDALKEYEAFNALPVNENGFMNNVSGRPYEDFKKWLVRQDNVSLGIGLEEWMVPQSVYYLEVDNEIVGIGKIRHRLTDSLREEGGNIGYAILPMFRNRGYGTLLLKELLIEAKRIGVPDVLITVMLTNQPSRKVCLNAGGIFWKETSERAYYIFDLEKVDI